MNKMYRYRVTHQDLGSVEVAAEDKLHAIHMAAKIWGVPWTSIARECEYERLRPVAAEQPKKKPETKRRPAVGKKGGTKA